MGNFVFNVAKGKVAYYATLPAANDAFIAVPLQSSGLEGDTDMMDRDTLADVLSASTNEQTTLGRTTMTGVTSTVDDSGNKVVVDMNDYTYTSASGAAVGAIIICYVPDTGSSTDSQIIPLTRHDFSAIPSGSNIPVQVSSNGLFVAQ